VRAAAENDLAVVVLHYGDVGVTRNCLRSLEGSDAAVYLVDNGPGSISAGDIACDGKTPVIVSTGSNLGFAGGMNAGIRKAFDDGARFIAILNNDTAAEPGFAKNVAAKFEEHRGERICFSPLILDRDGKKVWFGGGKLSWPAARAKHSGFYSSCFPEAPAVSDFLTGCAMCFSKSAVDEAGLMKEDYFLYWEDLDWSVRLRKEGYRLVVFPDIRIKHLGSAATGLESDGYLYYFHRNQLIFLFRNCPRFLLPISLAGFAANLLRVCSAWLLKHGKEGRHKIRMTLKGVFGFLLARRGPVPGTL